MTDETAKKCETALKAVEWTGLMAKERIGMPTGLRSCCPLCSWRSDDVHAQSCPIRTALAALHDEMRVHPADKPPSDPEQKAREVFARLQWSSLAELADLIASHERLLAAIKGVPDFVNMSLLEEWWERYSGAIDNAWKPEDA